MAIRAILFDLDGTLIDQFQAIHKAFALTLERMGFNKPSFEEVKRAVGGASESTMEKLIGPERAKEAVQVLRPIFEQEMLNGLTLLPGAKEILHWCKANKVKAAVLTNKHGPHARIACKHLGISNDLEFVIGADDTQWKKPDVSLTNYTLEKIGYNATETLYIGDSPYDYKTAQNASMKCLLVSTGTHPMHELCKLSSSLEVKADLKLLIPLVEKLL